MLIKATKVDGVYTADPVTDEDATLIPRVSYSEVLQRGLKVMDAAAISLCRENDLPVIVLNISKSGAILAALRGERIGSLVT